MDSEQRRPVVLGVKTPRGDHAAVRLAAEEAALRGRCLHVIHAFVWPLGPPREARWRSGSPRHIAERIVADAVSAARTACPGLRVSGRVIDGSPLSILWHYSRRAALLVLGTGTLRASVDIPVQSMAVQLPARAACPVIVADDTRCPHAPVVVGVDGSPGTAPALDLAFEEARLRRAPLLVVQAGRPEREVTGGPHTVLHHTLAWWLARYPTVSVTQRVVAAPAVQALTEMSRHAQLLVVGARGWRARLLGSVTQAMLHHAACPVAVGREPARLP